MGSLGQQLGQDIPWVCLCSLVWARLGSLECWASQHSLRRGLRLERPLPRWLPLSRVERFCGPEVGFSFMPVCGLSNRMVSGSWMSPRPIPLRGPCGGCMASPDSPSRHSESLLLHSFTSYKWTEGQPRFKGRGMWPYFFFVNPHLRMYLLILEREEGRDREKDRQTDRQWRERETLMGCLPYVTRPGFEPAT